MNTIKHLSLLVMLTMMLSSCGILLCPPIQERAQGIKAGMTSQEVRSILGNNFYLSFHDNSETWEYRTNPLYHDYSVIKIEFKEGQVVRMDSYMEVTPVIEEKTKKAEK